MLLVVLRVSVETVTEVLVVQVGLSVCKLVEQVGHLAQPERLVRVERLNLLVTLQQAAALVVE